MFQSTAVVGVVEAAQRMTLHMHALSWNTFKPEMLENLSAYTFWATKLSRIVDSVFKTEIPPLVHLKSMLLYDVGGLPKPRPSREMPGNLDNNIKYSLIDIEKAIIKNAERITSLTSVHSHILTSCLRKTVKIETLLSETDPKKVKCRFGYGCKVCCKTKFLEISLNSTNSLSVGILLILNYTFY